MGLKGGLLLPPRLPSCPAHANLQALPLQGQLPSPVSPKASQASPLALLSGLRWVLPGTNLSRGASCIPSSYPSLASPVRKEPLAPQGWGHQDMTPVGRFQAPGQAGGLFLSLRAGASRYASSFSEAHGGEPCRDGIRSQT